MDAVRQMLGTPSCQNPMNDVVAETTVTVGVPDSISVNIVKLVQLISATLAAHPQLPSQQDLSSKISVLEDRRAVKISGSHDVVSLQMHDLCTDIIDLRDDLIKAFQLALTASSEHTGPTGAIDVSTRSQSGASGSQSGGGFHFASISERGMPQPKARKKKR
jgi:hypothetical protein